MGAYESKFKKTEQEKKLKVSPSNPEFITLYADATGRKCFKDLIRTNIFHKYLIFFFESKQWL
jgi:hypothetical protein